MWGVPKIPVPKIPGREASGKTMSPPVPQPPTSQAISWSCMAAILPIFDFIQYLSNHLRYNPV